MGRICKKRGRKEICIQGPGGKTCKKEATWKTQREGMICVLELRYLISQSDNCVYKAHWCIINEVGAQFVLPDTSLTAVQQMISNHQMTRNLNKMARHAVTVGCKPCISKVKCQGRFFIQCDLWLVTDMYIWWRALSESQEEASQ